MTHKIRLNAHAQFAHKICRAGLLMLSLLIFTIPAFGQSDYSDVWLSGPSYSGDDATYDDNQAPMEIVAAGVTDSDYSSDLIAVEVTLSSPNGRTITDESASYGSTRTEITLPWDFIDIGAYTAHAIHQPLCWGNWDGSMIYEWRAGGHIYYSWNPDYFRCAEGRETYRSSIFGVSFSCYRKYFQSAVGDTVVASYFVIPNCDCACKSQTATVRYHRGPLYTPKEFLYVAEPYIYSPVFNKICSHITANQEVNECANCSDLDVPTIFPPP